MEKYQNHVKNTFKTALDSSVTRDFCEGELVAMAACSLGPSALWLLGCPVFLQMLGEFVFLVEAVSQGKDS